MALIVDHEGRRHWRILRVRAKDTIQANPRRAIRCLAAIALIGAIVLHALGRSVLADDEDDGRAAVPAAATAPIQRTAVR